MSAHPVKILVIDPERHHLETVRRGLFLHGYDCVCASSDREALDLLRNGNGHQVAAMVVDVSSTARPVLHLIHAARQIRPDLPVMALTGLADGGAHHVLRDLGIPCLRKPFAPDLLADALERLLTHQLA